MPTFRNLSCPCLLPQDTPFPLTVLPSLVLILCLRPPLLRPLSSHAPRTCSCLPCPSCLSRPLATTSYSDSPPAFSHPAQPPTPHSCPGKAGGSGCSLSTRQERHAMELGRCPPHQSNFVYTATCLCLGNAKFILPPPLEKDLFYYFFLDIYTMFFVSLYF